MMERDGESKNTLYRPKRLKKSCKPELKQKNSRKYNPLPFYIPFFNKRYPFHIPSISDKWCPIHIPCLELCIPFDCYKSMNFFLHRNQSQKEPVHRRCFIFLFVLTPLHWRLINPLRFIFYHPLSTDFE